MNRDNLEGVINDIRSEPVDEQIVNEAAARVRARVFAAAADPASTTLRNCGDFQALMRQYLAKSLPESRVMLLEDHIHSCVDCRRALMAARTGKVRTIARPQMVQHEFPRYTKWAMAAALLAAVGLSSWGVIRMLPSAGTRANVQSVAGVLYAVSDQSSTPIFSGREIGDGQHVRTGKDSTALLRMTDGSLVELNERAEIAISKNARGATIHLNGGSIIVQAARQKSGALYVKTPDCLVTVHGTVFAVTRGVKGTRVSVAEGEVKVDESGHSQLLHPGDQTATTSAIQKSAVPDEFAWSRNSAKYLALLGEFSVIQKRMAETPGPALRYSSKLLDLVPENTVLYAAIPNLGNTLAEANKLFNERIQQSEVLREWWSEHEAKGGRNLEDIVNRLRTFSSYLGDEVVLSIAGNWEGKYSAPLLLAEVKRPGLKDFLEGQARELAPSGTTAFRFVDDAAAEPRENSQPKATGASPMVMTIKDNVLAIGTSDSVRNFATGSSFDRGYFYRVISQSYQSGVGWLFCANVEQILRNTVLKKDSDAENSPTGLQDVRYIIFERKETNGVTDNRVALNFRGNRRGFASWLGSPGAMGALDYVSPNALVAAGFVLRNPHALVSEMFHYFEGQNSTFTQELADFEKRSGINVLNDVAGPLGTDAAFAIDGPIFPVPNWEFAIETYSPDRLEWTIEKLVAEFNNHSADTKLTLTKDEVNGKAFYTLAGSNMNLEAHYTFTDSYLLAAATQGMLLRAIQNHQNGYTLTRSERFKALLPRDSYPSFSGLIYHNVGPLIGPITDQIKTLKAITPAQRASIDALQANNAPGLIFAYGEPNRIVISGTGPLFGLSLESMAVPNILANAIHGGNRLRMQSQ